MHAENISVNYETKENKPESSAQKTSSSPYKMDMEVSREDFHYKEEKESLLGSGSFSEVYRGRFKGKDVAVKKIIRFMTSDKNKEFSNEIELMFRGGKLDYQYVTPLMGVCTKPDFFIIMEYMPLGSLRTFLTDKGQRIAWITRYRIALDIAEAVRMFHNLEIIHRDLKSHNVLLTGSTDNPRAKVTDFGIARRISEIRVGSNNGSGPWMDPELWDKPWTYSAEIYSLGKIFWELVTCAMPKRFGDEDFSECYCPPKFQELIKKCWLKPNSERPKPEEIIRELQFLVNSELKSPSPLPLDCDLKEDKLVPTSRPNCIKKIGKLGTCGVLIFLCFYLIKDRYYKDEDWNIHSFPRLDLKPNLFVNVEPWCVNEPFLNEIECPAIVYQSTEDEVLIPTDKKDLSIKKQKILSRDNIYVQPFPWERLVYGLIIIGFFIIICCRYSNNRKKNSSKADPATHARIAEGSYTGSCSA